MLSQFGLYWLAVIAEVKESAISFLPPVVHQLKQKIFNVIIGICVDDQTPRFSFVTVYGTAKIYHYRQNKLFEWANKIAKRYMGKASAEACGIRNSTEGEVLVRIKPTRIIAERDIAA